MRTHRRRRRNQRKQTLFALLPPRIIRRSRKNIKRGGRKQRLSTSRNRKLFHYFRAFKNSKHKKNCSVEAMKLSRLVREQINNKVSYTVEQNKNKWNQMIRGKYKNLKSIIIWQPRSAKTMERREYKYQNKRCVIVSDNFLFRWRQKRLLRLAKQSCSSFQF